MQKNTFTAREIVDTIIKDDKYYNNCKPQYKPSTAFRIVAAIKAGTCKPDTERKFLLAFGYHVQSEVQYSKSVN